MKPFEQQTGCQVNAKYAGSSDEMVTLMKNGGGGQYDMVSSSGDADLRILYAGDARPVNINLIPSWKDFYPAFQSPPFNTINGVHYGVSLQWGPNVLMYSKKDFSTAPTSWSVIYDSKYKGQVTVPDNPIQIADAALYLKTHNPSLKITDPYELTQPQFQAAVNLLAKQRPLIEKYWALASQEIFDFKNGNATVGAGWPYQVSTLRADKFPIGDTIPSARAPPAGPTPGCWPPRRRTPTARTCGCATSARPRSRPSRRSTTARRRTTSSPAPTWTRCRRGRARSTTRTPRRATSSPSRCGRRRSRPATTASPTACPTPSGCPRGTPRSSERARRPAPGPVADGGHRPGGAARCRRAAGEMVPRLGRAVAPAVGAGHHPAHAAAGLVRPGVPGRAGGPADHGVLADQPVHDQHRAGLEPRQHHRHPEQRRLPGGHPAHGRDGRGGHRDRRDRRVSRSPTYMARLASPRTRIALFVAILLPLWASYLAKVYAWLLIFTHDGLLDWGMGKIGLGAPHLIYTNWAVFTVFCYIWLPFMIIPVYAAIERIPESQIEASQDLGGRTWRTTRLILLPLALPGIVAGSIFTFSLTLGDYITPILVGGTSANFMGNIIYSNIGIANNVPFAAAMALFPIVIMAVYLFGARALGAFEAV